MEKLSGINVNTNINSNLSKQIFDSNTNTDKSLFTDDLPANNNIPINGKLDLDFRQGTKTGDCELLSLLLSMKDKTSGKKFLESLLSYNENENSITVNLKSQNESYTFTKDELSKYNALSTGDGDIRAIELAMAKHLYEQKENKDEKFSPEKLLSGISSYKTLNILTGDRKISTYKNLDSLIDDFGNQDRFFQLSFFQTTDNPESDEVVLKSHIALNPNTHIYHPIFCNHSYSIINSDKDSIYLRNPHDSSDVLKVKRSIIKDANGIVTCNRLE